MSIRSTIAVAGVLIAVGYAAVAGETWRWKDAAGQVHFGDRPPPDVAAEPIQLRPTAPALTDEARAQREQEQRERESAREETDAREARRAAAADERAGAETAMNRTRCERARWALAALDSGRPVYRDATGAYRVKRPPHQLDAYTGPREYLDDTERQAEIARYQRDMDLYCADFPELQDPAAADADLRRAEACEAAAVELESMMQDTRTAPEEIAHRRRFLDEQCR